MKKRITIIQSHPDPSGKHFGNALAEAYLRGANEAGHEVRVVNVARLEFPLLRTHEEWQSGALPAQLTGAQESIAWADHLVFFFPLWLGTMPAVLKAFLEQVLRPGFAFTNPESGQPWKRLLKGKSARLVVTMGMPAFLYRWFFFAHGLKGLERSVLGFCGISPVRETLIGLVEAGEERNRKKWLPALHALGKKGK